MLSGADRSGLSDTCCVPPDTTGAIGPSHYVEMVNSTIGIYDRNLNSIIQQKFTTFFGLGDPNNRYCDPQVEWDPQGNRWFYSLLYCGSPTSGAQSFDFGWSKTADPTATWCGPYQVDTGTVLDDFPRLGHDDNFLAIGTNLFDSTGKFLGANIWAIPKPPAAQATCPATPAATAFADPSRPLLASDGGKAFAPVPANSMQSTPSDYILSADLPDAAGPGSKLMVWHLQRNPDGTPALVADGQMAVPPYAFSPDVPQPGSTWLIDSGDTRFTQAVALQDPASGALAVWAQHTIADPGGSGRSIIRWYEVRPSTLTVLQMGTIASPYDYVFNGAISPSSGGSDAVIIYNRGSASLYPVIAAQSRQASTPSGAMDEGELMLAGGSALTFNGTCGQTLSTSPCRWGDYAGATPDPTQTGVVWGSSQVTGGSGPWETDNFAIAGMATAPGAPTGVHATAGNHSATASWTAPASIGRGPISSYTVTPYIGSAPQPPATVSGAATSAAFDGLTNGDQYTFTVTASNSYGPGPASQPSNAVTPIGGKAIRDVPPPGSSISRAPSDTIPPPGSGRTGAPPAPPLNSTPAQQRNFPPPPGEGRVGADTTPPAYGSDQAVTYQENAAHSGSQPADPLTLPLRKRWSVDLGASVSYPLIAGGKVYAITDSTLPGNAGISKLVALDQATGSTAWQQLLPYTNWGFTGIAYDGGRVFAVTYTGDMIAYDAQLGLPLWTAHMAPQQSWWTSPPVAVEGVVYSVGTGTGATLFAIRESDGVVLWTKSLTAGAGPALTPGSLFLNLGAGAAQAINPSNRSVIWTQSAGQTGSGGPPAVMYGQRMYNLDPASNALPQPQSKIIDVKSGSQVGCFIASASPAFEGSRAFFLNLTVLQARDIGSNALLWSYTADAQVNVAPITVNQDVVIASSSGTVTVLNAGTGIVAWSGNAGAPIAASGGPQAGLAVGQGLLVIPASTLLVAYD